MAFDEANRVSLWQSLLAWAVILIAYGVLRVARRNTVAPRADDLNASVAPADA
jgi:hypothetical protein